MKPPSDLLSAARAESGKTQAKIAEELGVTQPCVSSWESGGNIPKPGEARVVARAYGLDHESLLDSILAVLRRRAAEKAS